MHCSVSRFALHRVIVVVAVVVVGCRHVRFASAIYVHWYYRETRRLPDDSIYNKDTEKCTMQWQLAAHASTSTHVFVLPLRLFTALRSLPTLCVNLSPSAMGNVQCHHMVSTEHSTHTLSRCVFLVSFLTARWQWERFGSEKQRSTHSIYLRRYGTQFVAHNANGTHTKQQCVEATAHTQHKIITIIM